MRLLSTEKQCLATVRANPRSRRLISRCSAALQAGMHLIIFRRIFICTCLALATCGCARDASPAAAAASERQKAAFVAARDQCGTTVADTAEVQRCMRAKGWIYRLPWQ